MPGELTIEVTEAGSFGIEIGVPHLYLVYRDSGNGEEYVIRAGPPNAWQLFGGRMKIETNVPIEKSADDRGDDTPEDRESTALDFAGLTDDEAWAIMVKYCREITAEDYRYNALEENSNALIGAMLHAAGAEKPASLLPPGIDSGDAIGFSHWDDIVDDVAPPADGIFRGTAGADRIAGLQFDEVFRLKDGRDRLEAGRGDDAAYGGGGRDRLSGQAGADELRGGSGHDVLNGGRDDDILRGGAGHDTLHGGWGADLLVGGAGADVFSFTNPGGRDVVADFEDGLDLLRLEIPGITDFTQLVLGRSGATGENTLVSFEHASIELVGLDLDRFGPEDVAIPLVSALV